jgi:tetratricopeptide (TPR) repeat protein
MHVDSEQKAIALLDNAFEKRAMGEAVAALSLFEDLELLSTHPKDISALHLFQTYCLMDLNRLEDASNRIAAIEASNLEDPLRINYEYEFARIARARGRLLEARDHAEEVSKIFKKTKEKTLVAESSIRNARILFGIILAELGECSRAISILKEVGVTDSAWAESSLLLGDCYVTAKKFDLAIKCYQSVISSGLDIGGTMMNDLLRNLGVALYWKGRYSESIQYLERVSGAYHAYPKLTKQIEDLKSAARLHLEKH